MFLLVIGHIVLTDHIVPIVQVQVDMEIMEAMRVMQAMHHIQTMAHIQIRIPVMRAIQAPAAADVPTIKTPVVTATVDTFKLPDVNQNIELPNGTPASSIMPSLAVPASSVGTKIDAGEIHQPSATDKVE